MDKYQAAYITLVVSIGLVILLSSPLKREEDYIVNETHEIKSSYHAVRLEYSHGEEVWITLRSEETTKRLTIIVRYSLGIHVRSCKLRIGGDIDRLGLLTMRGLDATISVNRTIEGYYYINLTDIGISGINRFMQDYVIQCGEKGRLELAMVIEVEVGRTIRVLKYSYIFEEPN